MQAVTYTLKFRLDGKRGKVKDQKDLTEERVKLILDAYETNWRDGLLSKEERDLYDSSSPLYIPFNRAVIITREPLAMVVINDFGHVLTWEVVREK